MPWPKAQAKAIYLKERSKGRSQSKTAQKAKSSMRGKTSKGGRKR